MSSCARCGEWADEAIGICVDCESTPRSKPMRCGPAEFLVHRGVALPPACVRCGEAVTRALRLPDDATLFVWEHLLRQISPVAKLLSLVLPRTLYRRQSLLIVPLCARHIRRRRHLHWIGAVLIAAMIPILGVAVSSPDESALFRSWFWALGTSFTGVILIARARRQIRPTEVTDSWARFTGANERFLALLDRR